MIAPPARLFAARFTARAEALREAEPDRVVTDGKTSRRARRGEGPAPHLVSARASLEVRRKTAGWDDDCLMTTITQTRP